MNRFVSVSPVTSDPDIMAVPIMSPAMTIAMLVFLRVKFLMLMRTVILSLAIMPIEIRKRTITL